MPRSRALAPALALALLLAGCAVNPATGDRQLSFMSEEEEIRMGREADGEIVQALGVYPDSSLQAYVAELGRELAARSERPDLPWTFRVLDDHVVNAFALPGGFIYVTRGLLAHMTSEAELAGVLGHEIGHVTARHSVNRMSRAQLAQLGLGLGMVLVPEMRPFQDLAGASFQLLFLKFGRDDERQADQLGVRYMKRGGYDPRELADVMRVLGRAGSASEGDRIPGWLSTHPDPEDREATIRQLAVQDTAFDLSSSLVRRDELIGRLEGVVFGPDPREGYVQESTFYHPELAFRADFPPGWRIVNRKTAVQAGSPEQDAALVLTLEESRSPESALRTFLAQEGVATGRTWGDPVHGLPAAWATFAVRTQEQELRGRVVFLAYGDRIYRFLGYAPAEAWSRRAEAVETSLESFRELTDPEALGVQPRRMALVRPERSLPFSDFMERYPSSVSSEAVALINQVEEGETLGAGTLYKRVTGGELP